MKYMVAEMESAGKKYEKSYFEVLGLCCSSEVPLIENILQPLDGVRSVSVIIPSRTVIVLHDPNLISQLQIVKALNQARLEANVRVRGENNYRQKWPSPFTMACGAMLLLACLKFVYDPFKWVALGAVAAGIYPIFFKAIASLRNFRLDINVLMLIAVAGSIALRDYLEAATIVFLFSIAEFLEARASHKATAVMTSLTNIAPQRAVLADTGKEVDASQVPINANLAVKAGEIIPIDGVVVEGNCEVDEKTLTGESFPVAKQLDSTVWAGSINLNGYITVRTTAMAEDCVVARMAKLVEEAQNTKSKTERFIDKCAKFYTPVVVVISAGLAVIPAALKLHNRNELYHLALVILVSACPCALILSTPVATCCALSKAATSGLLIKGSEYLETLAKVKTVAFDKTGTITRGEFSVTSFQSLIDKVGLDTLIYWVSSIESKSSHPMAAALTDYAQSHSVEPKPEKVEEFQNFPGEGIYGKIDGKDIYIGNRKIAVRAGCATVPRFDGESNEGRSTGYIFLGTSPAGIFSLADVCRTGVEEALKELKSMGIKTAMLTGDCQEAATYAQNQLGGALEEIYFELLPQDKTRIIQEFQKESRTAMVGDGLNDAPALATADIGISMGISGSALATETGHIILMSNDIRKIPEAAKLSRKTRRKIFENILICIVTKAGIIALALAGHPLVWAAILADVGTCLLVIFNSMLLLRGTGGYGKKPSHSHHHHKKGCKTSNHHCHSSHSHTTCSTDSKAEDQKKCCSEKSSCGGNAKVQNKCEPGKKKNNKCHDSENKHGEVHHEIKMHCCEHEREGTVDHDSPSERKHCHDSMDEHTVTNNAEYSHSDHHCIATADDDHDHEQHCHSNHSLIDEKHCHSDNSGTAEKHCHSDPHAGDKDKRITDEEMGNAVKSSGCCKYYSINHNDCNINHVRLHNDVVECSGVRASLSLEKRYVGECCKSYMRCCGNTGIGIPEIVIES